MSSAGKNAGHDEEDELDAFLYGSNKKTDADAGMWWYGNNARPEADANRISFGHFRHSLQTTLGMV